jgi:hypothetical protein
VACALRVRAPIRVPSLLLNNKFHHAERLR